MMTVSRTTFMYNITLSNKYLQQLKRTDERDVRSCGLYTVPFGLLAALEL